MTTDSAENFLNWLHRHGYRLCRPDRDHIGGIAFLHEVHDPSAVLAAFLAGADPTEAATRTIEPGPERRPTGGL